MLFTPGIYENLRFNQADTKISDKKSLVLSIEVADDTDAVDAAMAAIAGNTMLETGLKQEFIVFPPKTISWDKKTLTSTEILKDLLDIRDKLMKYGELVASTEEVTAAYGLFALFEGIGVTTEQYPMLIKGLVKQVNIDKVYTNLVNKFLAFTKAKPTFFTATFRHKFTRSSKKSHFSNIPFNYKSAIVEPMTVPTEQTKIVWSDAEIKNGKNNGDPVAKDLAKIDVKKKASLFDGGAPAAGTPTEEYPMPETQATPPPAVAPAGEGKALY